MGLSISFAACAVATYFGSHHLRRVNRFPVDAAGFGDAIPARPSAAEARYRLNCCYTSAVHLLRNDSADTRFEFDPTVRSSVSALNVFEYESAQARQCVLPLLSLRRRFLLNVLSNVRMSWRVAVPPNALHLGAPPHISVPHLRVVCAP